MKPISDKGGMQCGGSTPLHIFWDGDLIYVANKKAYGIMSKSTGEIKYTLLANQVSP